MSLLRPIIRRVLGLVGTLWVVFTLVFVYVVVTPFAGQDLVGDGAPATVGESLWAQYLDWLSWLVTIPGQSVFGTILAHLSYTATYFVPALAVAIGGATALRTYSIGREDNRLDGTISAVTIFAVSFPAFLVVLLFREWLLVPYFEMFDTSQIYHRALSPLAPTNLRAAVWPAVPMAMYLFAVQSRYAGDLLGEDATADFVKTARMKGAGAWAVGRHLFRHSGIPLLTVILTDMLGPTIVSIVTVEYVVGTPGIGELLIEALVHNETRLVVALAVFIVLIGVLANFIEDLAYLLFDPRVSPDD
jgi:peptide/nickel transport system permease protein